MSSACRPCRVCLNVQTNHTYINLPASREGPFFLFPLPPLQDVVAKGLGRNLRSPCAFIEAPGLAFDVGLRSCLIRLPQSGFSKLRLSKPQWALWSVPFPHSSLLFSFLFFPFLITLSLFSFPPSFLITLSFAQLPFLYSLPSLICVPSPGFASLVAVVFCQYSVQIISK